MTGQIKVKETLRRVMLLMLVVSQSLQRDFTRVPYYYKFYELLLNKFTACGDHKSSRLHMSTFYWL